MDGNERKRTESEARMLWNEIKKFWQYRSLIVILILALLLNLGVFVYSTGLCSSKTGSTHSGYNGAADGYSGF